MFTVDGYDELKAYCQSADIEWDDDRCILRREIAPAGRSRAFANDSPVPLAKLQAVAMRLIDIHSQHQNQLLATPEYQLTVIDTLAGNKNKLAEYTRRYNTLRDAIRRLKAMRLLVEKNREDEEFTRYQLEQLDELALSKGEQEELENEKEVLTNLSAIKSALQRATAALSGDGQNAVDMIDEAIDSCDELDGVLQASDDIPSRLESARIEIADISSTLEGINERLLADPGRLEAVDERLNAIYTLCHKHRLNNGDELIVLRDSLRKNLMISTTVTTRWPSWRRKPVAPKALAKETAMEISESRKKEALSFAEHLREVATPLGMKNLRVEVEVQPADMGPTGIDAVRFMVSFNKNQTLMPVGDTASGGEISRLMLSIKTIIASRMSLPSIIFDEIDTGVSGDVANRMALMMREISKSLQVTAITHLPQVAAKGNTQYRVYKEDDEHSTHTRIRQLADSERVDAIAAMLGGASVDDAARQAAKSLLNS